MSDKLVEELLESGKHLYYVPDIESIYNEYPDVDKDHMRKVIENARIADSERFFERYIEGREETKWK